MVGKRLSILCKSYRFVRNSIRLVSLVFPFKLITRIPVEVVYAYKISDPDTLGCFLPMNFLGHS